MRSVTSRNTPLDQPDIDSVQRIWGEPVIDPRAVQERDAKSHVSLSPQREGGADVRGRIHVHSSSGEVELIGENGLLRVEISRGTDPAASEDMLRRITDSSSPLWLLARELSVGVDVTVDGASVAFYDAASKEISGSRVRSNARPGTDRRLDADEPYGDWTYLDPANLAEGGGGTA